jgi:hypothetical protein
MNTALRVSLWLALLSLIMAGPIKEKAAEAGSVQSGLWGGEHVSLEVTERGGKVEFDCAHGTLDRKITLDRRGRFDVPGTYVEEHGGPIRRDERSTSYPVRVTGRVKGGDMQMTVRRRDTGQFLGTFSLVRGREPMLFECR